jgi:hypothetical protein
MEQTARVHRIRTRVLGILATLVILALDTLATLVILALGIPALGIPARAILARVDALALVGLTVPRASAASATNHILSSGTITVAITVGGTVAVATAGPSLPVLSGTPEAPEAPDTTGRAAHIAPHHRILALCDLRTLRHDSPTVPMVCFKYLWMAHTGELCVMTTLVSGMRRLCAARSAFRQSTRHGTEGMAMEEVGRSTSTTFIAGAGSPTSRSASTTAGASTTAAIARMWL